MRVIDLFSSVADEILYGGSRLIFIRGRICPFLSNFLPWVILDKRGGRKPDYIKNRDLFWHLPLIPPMNALWSGAETHYSEFRFYWSGTYAPYFPRLDTPLNTAEKNAKHNSVSYKEHGSYNTSPFRRL